MQLRNEGISCNFMIAPEETLRWLDLKSKANGENLSALRIRFCRLHFL